MTDISVTTTATYQAEKRDWLGSDHGTDFTPSCVVDVSAFTAATHYPNGYLLSGIALGKITATSTGGKTVVGPYNDSLSTGQEVFYGYLYGSLKVPNTADTTKDVAGAVLVHGFVIEAKLPIASGATGRGYIDAAGKVDNPLIHHSAV